MATVEKLSGLYLIVGTDAHEAAIERGDVQAKEIERLRCELDAARSVICELQGQLAETQRELSRTQGRADFAEHEISRLRGVVVFKWE